MLLSTLKNFIVVSILKLFYNTHIRVQPWLLSLSCSPTNAVSVKDIISVSFDYIVRIIPANKLSCDIYCECVTSQVIIVVYDLSHHE